MMVTLNGRREELTAAMRVSDLLKQKELQPQHVVVEINRCIIEREDFSTTEIRANDTIELLNFVGGG